MQFFYRIFRKNKVLLRKRKIPIVSSQGKVDALNSAALSSLAPPTSTCSSTNSGIRSGGESSKATAGNGAKRIKMDVTDGNSSARCGVAVCAAVPASTEKHRRENQALSMSAPVGERSHNAQSQLRHQRQDQKSPKKVDFAGNKHNPSSENRPHVAANCVRQIGPQVVPSSPLSQQQPPPPRRHETINVTAKDVKQILEELKEKTAAAAAAEAAAAAKGEEDFRLAGNAATCNQQGKGPQPKQAAAHSAASKISQEQKLAIRNFRLGGGQVQQSSATSAAFQGQGDSEKILSIVSTLHKKQVAKQQQQNVCNPVPRAVHSGLSPKTTIQKTTVSSIQFGTMKHPPSAPSAKTPDTTSPRLNKSASLVVPHHQQQQQQPASAVSAMERHLAKTLPSGTAVTVKMAAAAAARAAGATSNDKPYNNRDGIITPIIKKDAMSGGARTDLVRKSLSDRSFINVSEALMKQKTVLSCASAGGGGGGLPGQQQLPVPRPTMSAMFKSAAAANVVRGNSTPPPGTSGVASQSQPTTTAMRNQFPASLLATTTPHPLTTTSTVAAAFPGLTAAVAANSQSPQLAAMTAAVAVANLEAASTPDSLGIQTQIPKNRLEVKLQQPSVPHNAVLNPTSAVLAQPQQIISFRKQPPVAELLWSGPPVTTAAAAAGVANIVHKDASGGSVVGPRKTLNQGIRQIPNPSLLTNKQKIGSETGDIPATTE